MHGKRTHRTAHPHHLCLNHICPWTTDYHPPNETAQQLFFLCRPQVPLPPEVGQRASQIPQLHLHLGGEAWWGLTPETLGRFTDVFHGL